MVGGAKYCDSPTERAAELELKRSSKPTRWKGGALSAECLRPNVVVRWAFYISVLAIPFTRIYLPGTGERLGVARLVQGLIFCAVLSQPRVCLRFVPMALFWFVGYCLARILAGLWLTPQLQVAWWPRTLDWLQFALPWVWITFNVLQFPNMGRRGLWDLIAGCSVCALFHVAGIGVVEVDQGIEGRSTVFRENANVVGAAYAIALIALVGLGMLRDLKPSRRLVLLPLMAVLAAALAKTGSRTAVLILAMGIGVLLLGGESFGSRTKRVGILVVTCAILAGVLWQIPTVMKRFEQLDRGKLDRQEARVRMIPVLWDIFQRSPIHGSGPAGYQFELTRRAMPHMIKEQKTIAAHNLALLLLVETGIIGFLLFAAGIRQALLSAWKARLRSCGSVPLALILPLIIAGVIVSDPSHHLVFWFAIAYALAGEKTC